MHQSVKCTHFLYPEQFRRLHFHRHGSPYVAQNPVLGGIDALDLAGCTMVHPHDHIPMALSLGETGKEFF